MKITCFFGPRFWKHFGRVLGGQNSRISLFFRHFFDAKFRVQFGRAKNRKKSAQDDFIPNFGGLCGPGGKEKGWGEGNLAGNLACILGLISWLCFSGMHFWSLDLLSGTHGSPFGRRRMCCAQTAAPEGKKAKSE